jgi:hypothetical protein
MNCSIEASGGEASKATAARETIGAILWASVGAGRADNRQAIAAAKAKAATGNFERFMGSSGKRDDTTV